MRSSYILKSLALMSISAVFGFALRADASTYSDAAADFAGSYYYRHPNLTMSLVLIITPDSHFNLTEIGCFGNSETSHGRVTFKDGVLVLDPQVRAERVFGFDSNAMIPVHWHDKLYLVHANRVGDFAEATSTQAGNCRFQCRGFFIREGDMD